MHNLYCVAAMPFYKETLKLTTLSLCWHKMPNFYSAILSTNPNSIHSLWLGLVIHPQQSLLQWQKSVIINDGYTKNLWWVFWYLFCFSFWCSYLTPDKLNQCVDSGLFYSRNIFRISPSKARDKIRALWSHTSSIS